MPAVLGATESLPLPRGSLREMPLGRPSEELHAFRAWPLAVAGLHRTKGMPGQRGRQDRGTQVQASCSPQVQLQLCI